MFQNQVEAIISSLSKRFEHFGITLVHLVIYWVAFQIHVYHHCCSVCKGSFQIFYNINILKIESFNEYWCYHNNVNVGGKTECQVL